MVNGIHRIEKDDSLKECVEVLRDAFSTVTLEFGLTVDNCPSNAGFIDFGKIKYSTKQGVDYFGFYENGKIIGCLGLKEKMNKVFEITKLGVVTTKRSNSVGKKLVEYSFDYSISKKGNKVVLGMIDENEALKKWYMNHGFIITKRKKFRRLPFWVCFMEKPLNLK